MSKRRIVYATDIGELCPNCQGGIKTCKCQSQQTYADGVILLKRQTKGRNGKAVSLITGIPLPVSELKKLASELKSKCGVGGSVEGSCILIQGDKRGLLKELLKKQGFKVKLSGG